MFPVNSILKCHIHVVFTALPGKETVQFPWAAPFNALQLLQ